MVMINYSIYNEIVKKSNRFSKPSNKFGHTGFETHNTPKEINSSIEHRCSGKIQIHNS